jgi:hypothetical protein
MTGARADAAIAARARRLLGQRGAWIAEAPDGYALRPGGDRRSRIAMVLNEAAFCLLVEEPGLRTRPGGGWVARSAAPVRAETAEPGRPGRIDGTLTVMTGDGGATQRRANLGQSAIIWLSRRKDADGRPWLAPAEVAAGARLGLDAELASRGPSVTMRWDALPRAGGGSAARAEPGDPAMAAERRVQAALATTGAARPMIEAICIRASALQAAERDLGLRRREGKRLLRTGLAALAAHYRIG